MNEKPQSEHDWLHKLIGEWTYKSTCKMGPDQPDMLITGTEVVRSLGGLWTIAEGTNEHGQSIMTLGYVPKQNQFVGTFVASMMTYLWTYIGQIDATGNKLILDAEGPNFSERGGVAKYQDVIEFHDEDHRTMTSHMLMPSGEWLLFMTVNYRRTK